MRILIGQIFARSRSLLFAVLWSARTRCGDLPIRRVQLVYFQTAVAHWQGARRIEGTDTDPLLGSAMKQTKRSKKGGQVEAGLAAYSAAGGRGAQYCAVLAGTGNGHFWAWLIQLHNISRALSPIFLYYHALPHAQAFTIVPEN